MRLRSAWVVAVLALGCGTANEGATFDETGNGGSGGDAEPLDDESSGAGGSTGGTATVGVSSSGGASSVAAATSSSASSVTGPATGSTSSGTSSTVATSSTGPTVTASISSATTSATSSVSTSAAASATTGETAAGSTASTASAVTTGTTGGGCECEAPANPDLEHIAYLTDPPNMHVSCCDGCNYREALSRCIVAAECVNSYNFLVQWATCDGESDVCADHGIAADPGLNAGLTGAPCSLRSSGENEECEMSETGAACY